ncbi:hypothetical protein [Candidatus Electronema sp. JM]|uniref:hypothetical protein n=1 Tax=Candidatus Electronema sp. JM TaxID=3401571 RepID=UPI003AA9359F
MPTQHQPNAAMQETTPAPSTAPECRYFGRCPICGTNPTVSRVFDGQLNGWLVQGDISVGLHKPCSFCNFELRSDVFSTFEDAKKAWCWKVSGFQRKYKEFFNRILIFHLTLAFICMTCGILGIIDFF